MKADKLIIVVALIAAAAVIMFGKNTGCGCGNSGATCAPGAESCPISPSAAATTLTDNTVSSGLPVLLDLGADKCIPCKMMAPVLDELRTEYAGRMDVRFIDVWVNEGQSEKYGIKSIPTQIFFDASGKELYRHEGFLSKEDIMKKWAEFDISFK